MSTPEIIAWVATAATLLSFTVNDIIKLRVINLIGCAFWIVSGLFTHSYPIIVTNTTIALIHLFWFYKNRKLK